MPTCQEVAENATDYSLMNTAKQFGGAIGLDEGDALVDVALTDGERDILLFGSHGKCVVVIAHDGSVDLAQP